MIDDVAESNNTTANALFSLSTRSKFVYCHHLRHSELETHTTEIIKEVCNGRTDPDSYEWWNAR